MSIAFQCREVAAGPVVGYQVGAQGDGSGYIRQQQQQQQHQQKQDAVIRGLSCISIYVQSNPDGVPGQKGTDGSSLRALGGGQEVFRAVGQDHQVGFQPASAVLDLTTNKDFDCNIRAECNSGSQYGNHKRSAEDPLEHLGNFGAQKDSPSVSSSSITDDNCSSSSIDDDEETSGDMEVESKLKGPLDSMAELEDSLPIKRGLSNFFSGKSKSFTCLSDVASVKDLAKPENPYNKRRRNLLAYGNSWERNRFHPPRNGNAGISKKAMHTSKSTLALAVAMSKSEDSLEKDENDAHLPPLPPQGRWQRNFASPRSFSLTDLQGV